MSIFQEISLTWGDNEYSVAPDKVMGLIGTIEQYITIEDLLSKKPQRAKLSQAFAAALRYAGALVTDEDVYATLFGAAAAQQTANAVTMLLTMMIPPEHLQGKPAKAPAARQPKKNKTKALSRKRTSPRAAFGV